MKVRDIALGLIGFVVRGVILVLMILAVYRAGQKAYDFGFRIFTEEPMTPEPGRDVAITISQGDSTKDIGDMLEEKGLIRDSLLFVIQKKCSVYDGDIKPGFYTLNTSMTADDMFAIIAGKEGEEAELEEELDEAVATPLMEAAPLTEQTGTGEWEGSEEDEASLESEAASDGEGADEASDSLNIEITTE